MPLTKTPETNIVFGPQPKFEMPEHTGGDGWNTTTANEGDTVSFTLELAAGYDPGTLAVTR